MREKTIKTDGHKFLLDALKLAGISRRDKIPYYRTKSNLDLTDVKYSTFKQSREEYLKVMERIRPNSFMHSENVKST
jgi:hypothetical protein